MTPGLLAEWPLHGDNNENIGEEVWNSDTDKGNDHIIRTDSVELQQTEVVQDDATRPAVSLTICLSEIQCNYVKPQYPTDAIERTYVYIVQT